MRNISSNRFHREANNMLLTCLLSFTLFTDGLAFQHFDQGRPGREAELKLKENDTDIDHSRHVHANK